MLFYEEYLGEMSNKDKVEEEKLMLPLLETITGYLYLILELGTK